MVSGSRILLQIRKKLMFFKPQFFRDGASAVILLSMESAFCSLSISCVYFLHMRCKHIKNKTSELPGWKRRPPICLPFSAGWVRFVIGRLRGFPSNRATPRTFHKFVVCSGLLSLVRLLCLLESRITIVFCFYFSAVRRLWIGEYGSTIFQEVWNGASLQQP